MMKAILSAITAIGGSIAGAVTSNSKQVGWMVKQGVGWVLAVIVLWWVGTYMILPTQNASIESMREIAKATADTSAAMARQTEILQRIDRNTSK